MRLVMVLVMGFLIAHARAASVDQDRVNAFPTHRIGDRVAIYYPGQGRVCEFPGRIVQLLPGQQLCIQARCEMMLQGKRQIVTLTGTIDAANIYFAHALPASALQDVEISYVTTPSVQPTGPHRFLARLLSRIF